jgi:hypothetical protein
MRQKAGLLVIAVYSGLGNQMFHYAFYKYLLLNGYNVYLDTDSPMKKMQHEKHETFRLNYFNLSGIKFSRKEDIERLLESRYLPFRKAIEGKKIITIASILMWKIYIKICEKFKIKTVNINYWVEWEHGKEFYRTKLNYNTKAYMVGRYQEYGYLKNMREQLLVDFEFTQKTPVPVQGVLDNINKEQSVSIHVRRGDYAGAKEFDVCSIEYYKNAIEYITSLKRNLRYYIFSDDTEWVKGHFDFIEEYQVIDNSACENTDYWDLYLMSKCKYNIIANSTFSWWGAWLNQNPEKIVIVPEKWNGYDYVLTDEICPPEWKRIAI